MQGHRSENFDIIPYNLEIEHIIQQPQRERDNSEAGIIFEVEEKMAEAHVENPPERKSMKSSFIPQNLNQPSGIAFQPDVQRKLIYLLTCSIWFHTIEAHLMRILIHTFRTSLTFVKRKTPMA
jgi:hypothetical protein